MDLQQKVSEITYISFNLSVPYTLLACLQGGGEDVVKKCNLLNYHMIKYVLYKNDNSDNLESSLQLLVY